LRAAIEQAKGVQATLTPGHGGVFKVLVDGRVLYDRHAAGGRFPDESDIVAQL